MALAISNLIECQKLLNLINYTLTDSKKVSIYEDPNFFFDYIIEYSEKYINLCKITDVNRARYDILNKLNSLNSCYFIPSKCGIINNNADEWFYEIITIQEPIKTLSYNQLTVLWNNLNSLRDAAELFIQNDNFKDNNDMFRKISYYEEMRILLSENAFNEHDAKLKKPYVVFADIEKAFELGRIAFKNNHFTFSGLQSFLPCPMEYVKVVSVIYSSFEDSEDDIIKKLNSIRDSKITNIINAIKNQCIIRPEYYKIDKEMLLSHLTRLEQLCKRL